MLSLNSSNTRSAPSTRINPKRGYSRSTITYTVMAMTAVGGEQFVLACEAQGGHSAETIMKKRRNWPYYLAYLHERYKLPVVLLVLCQEKATVKWAQQPINLGLPVWPTLTVNPLVLGPHNIPLQQGPVPDEQLTQAVFSVMTHARHDVVDGILEEVAKALERADPTTRNEYAKAIWLALNPRPTATQWMELMKAMNMDEELAASLREGSVGEVVRGFETKAEAKGKAEGEANSVLRIVDRRRIALTVEQRERILGCTDLDTLNRWLDASLDATSADEIFG